jgi:hypothetical protein
MTKMERDKTTERNLSSKIAIYLSSLKDFQTTGKACSPQKRTSSNSKYEIY